MTTKYSFQIPHYNYNQVYTELIILESAHEWDTTAKGESGDRVIGGTSVESTAHDQHVDLCMH